MRLPALALFPRRWPKFGLAALLLLALAVLLLGPGAALSQNGPSVTGVAVSSSPASGGTYIGGDTIRITLTFSENVDVTGTPRLKIDMDPAEWGEKWAAYEGGSGTDTLTFTHTVAEPNISTRGIAVLADTLDLNGGTIKSAASSETNADLSHTGRPHDANHRVNWRLSSAEVPWVVKAAVSSAPASGDTYGLDETIRVTLTFNRTVEVTGSPRLKIDMDPAEWGEKWAGYESGGGTASLAFAHTVVEPNVSTQGIAVLANTLDLNGGAIRSAASDTNADLSHLGRPHDSAHQVDWQQSAEEQAEEPTPTAAPTPEPTPEPTEEPTPEPTEEPTPEPTQEPTPTPAPTPPPAPSVTGVAITSNAVGDDTYLLGETIRITLTFSEAVDVTGAPRLKIDMDPAEWGEKQAAYHSGSGTASLTFVHEVVEPNISTQGIAVLANSLELNGGSIKSASSDTDAELSHDGRDHGPDHKVDWRQSRPNRAPVVNTQSENYDNFTRDNNAPSEVLVSKPFYQVFSDPDGDELTYAVSIPEEHRQLVEEIVVTLDKDFQPETRGWPPVGTYDRVFFQAADDAEWKAMSPALADPVTVTATLTATDPEGLSVSLGGDFLIWWESHPEVVSAVAREEAIELTFDVAVEADPAPTAEQFTVKVVNGDATTGTVAVSGVSVNGAVATLRLGAELAAGQTVALDYAHDEDTPLKRAAAGGDHAASFTGQAVDMSSLGLPGAVSNLEVTAEPGQLDLLARWAEVEGATSYKLRWREFGGAFEAANASGITGAATGVITVSGYGQWEVRAQGCSEDSCGPEAAATVDVVPAASLSLERAVDDQGQVRPRTLTANWDRVEGAASYLLRWWPANEAPPAPAQQSSDTRQSRSIDRREANTQTSNQLTVPAGRTGVEFSVPDDRAYRVDLHARGGGREILARGDAGVDQAPGAPDTTPPTIVRGEINGNKMTVYFSEPLDEDHVWGKFTALLHYPRYFTYADFSSNMVVSGNAVTVDFRDDLWAGSGLRVATYYLTDSTGRALRDLAGNRVNTSLCWHSGATSTRLIYLSNLTPSPMLDSVEAYPYWVEVAFDHWLDERSVPPASAFTVTVNGTAVSLAEFQPVNVAGKTVRLVLAAPVSSTDVLAVSYAKPSSGSKLRGVAREVAGFVGHAVTNRVGDVPAVERVAITSTPAAVQTYAQGEAVQVSLTFSEAVTVDTAGGTPRLKIGMPAHHEERWANYSSGSGTTTLTFAYSVADLDRSAQGIAVLRGGLDVNGGSVQSVSTPLKDARLWYGGLDHDPAHMVDWRRSAPGVPWITGVDITSDPGAHGAYSPGETLKVTLTYNQAVNVTGSPRLKIKMAPTYGEKIANYESGGGTTRLVFFYPVVAGNLSTRGVAVLSSTLELNGGTIRSTSATPVNAHLRHEGLRHNMQHRVDGIAPILQGVTVSGDKVSVSFNEALDADSVPPASAFTVKRTPQGGSEETVSLSGSPVITAGAVLLTLANAVAATDTGVKVSYAKPTASGASTLKDDLGNEVASFTDHATEAADATPPRLVRGEIDGDVITLYFSEPLDEDSVSSGVGDWFRIRWGFESWPPLDGQCPEGPIAHSTSLNPREVYVSGNTVVVAGLQQNRDKYRAIRNWTVAALTYLADVTVTNRLRDLSGNPVNTPYHWNGGYWATQPIPMSLDIVTRLPWPTSATVLGNQLTLTFSAPMDRGAVPAARAFIVKVNGSAASLAGSNPVSVSSREVTLTLAAAVATGDTVTVSYERPDSHWLRNVVCEYAPSFTEQAVTNATP